MKSVLDIVDKVTVRILDRQASEGGLLKDIISEELQKELGKIPFGCDLDGNEIYNLKTGETINYL